MQISIAINDALSSVWVRLFVLLTWQVVALYKKLSKEKVKARTTRSRTKEDKRIKIRRADACYDRIPRRENFPINSIRFLAQLYANKGRLKIALSSISNGALVWFTWQVAASSNVLCFYFGVTCLQIWSMKNEKMKTWTTRGRSRTTRSRPSAAK
ncbi:hypothetical protein Tsp_08417 [Trichinella spiralis]|uniref:hypothetical protein n=1 Tax=Trichinella spiralis TaxID=6334 RepID=UPI0001EFB577|nr:hypothetical protein Tsp_08417 [Trichinella spiralis]